MKSHSLSIAFLIGLVVGTISAEYENVFGQTLSSCSSDGMALTGYTRTGYCVDQNDDKGSHHICIDMSSTTGGNFCTVTGQSDWCSSEDMPCHEDQNQNCSVEHWCVCQWAFASYIENAGGCDAIQEVVCNDINRQALTAYQTQAASSQKYRTALNCLMEKCGIEHDSNAVYNMYASAIKGKLSAYVFAVPLIGAMLVAGGWW